MRHLKQGLKLNRTSSHRNAMFRNMVTSLFKNQHIRTTDVKAKELRRWADKMITLAKRGDLSARRRVLTVIREKAVAHQLFEIANDRFGSRQGGYTRITKIGARPGDAAAISLVELIMDGESKTKTKAKKEKTAKPVASSKPVPDVSKTTKASVDTVEPPQTSDAGSENEKQP